MKLKQVGFLDLVPATERRAALQEACSGPANPNRDRIIRYLKDAYLLILSAGVAEDLLSDSHPIIGPPHVMTDGTWAWPLDLAYYVEKYDYRLPDGFLEHMAASNWTCPQVTEPDQLSLDLYVCPGQAEGRKGGKGDKSSY